MPLFVVSLRAAVTGDEILLDVCETTKIPHIREAAFALCKSDDRDVAVILTLDGVTLEDDAELAKHLHAESRTEVLVSFCRMPHFSPGSSKGCDSRPALLGAEQPVVWSDDRRCVSINAEKHVVLVADEPCFLGETCSIAIKVPDAPGSICFGVTPPNPNPFFREGNDGPMWFIDPYDHGKGVIAIADGNADHTYRARCLTTEPNPSSQPFGVVVDAARPGETVQLHIDGKHRVVSFYREDANVASVQIKDLEFPIYPAVWVCRPKMPVSVRIVATTI
eukprot:TRINITY_DN41591_c0_g1_i1.p1 TRINITY_DN41591_c0_g1~~TRINITY_DN41591_c0_g1_i1.p1  ORF type:complete len:278 (+),score=3.95 TRINITY_DN41591_c0_g1_i1:47-880(+)